MATFAPTLGILPHLTDRTSCSVRQAANLWAGQSGHSAALDGGQWPDDRPGPDHRHTPVAGLWIYPQHRDHCFKAEADYGYCAAKDLYYMGLS